MPSPEVTKHIKQALSDCPGGGMLVYGVIEGLISRLPDESFADFHEVCETSAGFNLGSMACSGSHGWSGHHRHPPSIFRELVARGYNPNAPDHRGRIPSIMALDNSQMWMCLKDFRWAFSNGLDPLAIYPSPSFARSLLSVDFVNGYSSQVLDFLTETMESRLLSLDKTTQTETLEVLSGTALPCYRGLLARLESAAMAQSAPPLPASGTALPRF